MNVYLIETEEEPYAREIKGNSYTLDGDWLVFDHSSGNTRIATKGVKAIHCNQDRA